jgi:hypothetical protein
MRPTLHAPHSPLTNDASALGPEHPLVRATQQVTVAIDRCVAVSSLLAVGVLAAIGGLAFGPPLVIASAGVLAAQLIGLGSSTAARDLRALEVIGEGRGGLPHSAVARLRRRLLDPVQRERLARSLDALRVEAARPAEQCHSIRPIYDPRVVRILSAELSEVARLIREDGDLRGLARAERLVTDGCSPLYASSEAALRQELRQIRFFLAS